MHRAVGRDHGGRVVLLDDNRPRPGCLTDRLAADDGGLDGRAEARPEVDFATVFAGTRRRRRRGGRGLRLDRADEAQVDDLDRVGAGEAVAVAALVLGLGLWLGPDWFRLAMLIYSPLMALARISMGLHYLSDVVAGYALGLLLAAVSGWWMSSIGWLPALRAG